MKKFLLLLTCLGMSHLLVSVEEKTKKQKVRDFLTSKPMMVVYGAGIGGGTIKFFLYDALKKTVEELKTKNKDLEKENKKHPAKEQETDQKIQKLDQEVKELDRLKYAVVMNETIMSTENGIVGLLQKMADSFQKGEVYLQAAESYKKCELYFDKKTNKLYIPATVLANETQQILQQVTNIFVNYNTYLKYLNKTEVCFKQYTENGVVGIAFTNLDKVQQETPSYDAAIRDSLLQAKQIDETIKKEGFFSNYLVSLVDSNKHVSFKSDTNDRHWIHITSLTSQASDALKTIKRTLEIYNGYRQLQGKLMYNFQCVYWEEDPSLLYKLEFDPHLFKQ